MAPSYRERLRTEGVALAACGAAGSVALLGLAPEASRWPLNTVGQLVVAAGLIDRLGTRSVRRSMQKAVEAAPGEEGSGVPTPLWMLPVIVVGLAAVFVAPRWTDLPGSGGAGWDAGLRITAGCLLAGLAQAGRFEPAVAADEASTGRRYVRLAGSNLFGGTRLGFTRV